MHELSLMADLVRKIESVVRSEKARCVKSLKVRLGALSHLSGEHFLEHLREAVRGTSAEGARVELEVSEDLQDPRAQEIVLVSLELEVDT